MSVRVDEMEVTHTRKRILDGGFGDSNTYAKYNGHIDFQSASVDYML